MGIPHSIAFVRMRARAHTHTHPALCVAFSAERCSGLPLRRAEPSPLHQHPPEVYINCPEPLLTPNKSKKKTKFCTLRKYVCSIHTTAHAYASTHAHTVFTLTRKTHTRTHARARMLVVCTSRKRGLPALPPRKKRQQEPEPSNVPRQKAPWWENKR